jgi:hypothetical protein
VFATLPAKTCFEIREYPSEIVGAHAQQWVQGNKVYDGTLSSTPLFGRGDPYSVSIYSNTIGEYKVRLNFYLDTKDKEFTLSKDVVKDNIHYTNDNQFLGTWTTYLVKWFTINIGVNNVNVRYNAEDTNFIQNLMQEFKRQIETEIKAFLKGEQIHGVMDVGQIKINFTKPYP